LTVELIEELAWPAKLGEELAWPLHWSEVMPAVSMLIE
jgi:hypothetical protein